MSPNGNHRIDQDLGLAGQVQQLLFPKSSPVCGWCCIGVKNRMAQEIGGDYFDFISMPDQCQSIFLGDVTGHGVHASVVMSLLYGFIHRAAKNSCSASEIIYEINSFLDSFAQRTVFYDHFFSTTLFFGVINPTTLEMHYVNCGQVPPLVKQGEEIHHLLSTGPPLGFFTQPEIQLRRFQFQPGDRMLLCTDGLFEAKNSQGKQFGIERLGKVLKDQVGDHDQFLERLFSQVDSYCQSGENDDDMTAITFDFHHSFSTL